MAIIQKPRSNSQGVVDTTADLAQLNGRPGYQVLVKDVAIFEWVSTGVVDNNNIYPGLSGFWSRVIQSADGLFAFTPEDSANKSLNIVTDAASDVKYPSVKATKIYADSLVTGLLDDRGNFTPGLTSPGAWPTTGGSGTAGAIMKGDIWFCSASGFMGTTAVVAGASFRATVDTPGQTAGNWNVLSAGAISAATPSLSEVTAVGASTTSNMSISNGNAAIDFQVFSSSNGGVQLAVDSINKGYAYIASGNGTGAKIKANNITEDRNIQLPNASGTLALTSDIASTTPTLQQVTDAGNTTNDDVTISSNTSYSSFTVASTGGNGTVKLGYSTSWKGHLLLNNGSFSGIIRANNLTSSRSNIQLPDADGTLAIDSGVKIYTALLSFDGTTTTATVLQNTLGQTVSWSNPGTGVFRGTSDVGDVFTTDKTFISTIGYNNGGQPMIVTGARGNISPERRVEFRFFLHDGTIASTPLINKHPVEIRVYP
jgi:hypothetical protein